MYHFRPPGAPEPSASSSPGAAGAFPRPKMSASGLQRVAMETGAVMTLRRWDATSRPNGKSLVVFELAALFSVDLLDEVLREAGISTDKLQASDEDTDWDRAKRKVAAVIYKTGLYLS